MHSYITAECTEILHFTASLVIESKLIRVKYYSIVLHLTFNVTSVALLVSYYCFQCIEFYLQYLYLIVKKLNNLI